MTQPTRLHIDIQKHLASFDLNVQLDLGNEILVLFGPSGAGKTQTLNAIAGLVTPDAGEIALDGVPFFRRRRSGPPVNIPARQRHIGYVFQNYALFPHMTAVDNVAYALWRQPNARARALAHLDHLRIAHLADRTPAEMSGGQQQRVAIARALAAEPRVLLMDEPFSALDLAVRERLHHDLRTLQAERGLVVIYVTHSLDDAFAVGHRLAVVREGRIEQVGPLEAVFRRPTNASVVEVLGLPNVFAARVVAVSPEGLTLDWDGLLLEAPPQVGEVGALVTAHIRPEDVKILYPDRPLMSTVRHNIVSGRIVRKQLGRSSQTLRVRLANEHEVDISFPAFTYTPLPLEPGQVIQVSLRREGLVLLHSPESFRQD